MGISLPLDGGAFSLFDQAYTGLDDSRFQFTARPIR
jgi:hypothetical protein